MLIQEIIQSGANVSITVGTNDLLQFADHLIRSTKEELENAILTKKTTLLLLLTKQQKCYMLIAPPYGDGQKADI